MHQMLSLFIASSEKQIYYGVHMHDRRRYVISGLALLINETNEYKLRRDLFENMDVMVRPVVSSSDAVNVSFSVSFWNLADLVCFFTFYILIWHS